MAILRQSHGVYSFHSLSSLGCFSEGVDGMLSSANVGEAGIDEGFGSGGEF
jgi:hypothetical protein